MAVQRVAYAVPEVASFGDREGLNRTRDALDLKSSVALVLDQATSQVLLDKNSDVALPIASITKLMTTLVVVEAKQDMNEILEITDEDVDREKNSSSRLRPGTRMSRGDMLHIALMSSENRAASALGRNYPGGLAAAVAAMNAKAKALGMNDTRYVEPTGLSSQNVASARDLAKLVAAVQHEPLLCQYSTDSRYMVDASGREMQYRQYQSPGLESDLGNPAAKDRLYHRSRPLHGDAGHDRRARGHHGVPRFQGQVFASGGCRTHPQVARRGQINDGVAPGHDPA